ncbi:MFS transporter [Photobacterium minamisatsumaniensis]|uniref:MFS transporter n=1 Tax=Photobacterium minamisatsumaniensis TaxID=2910233 RepID=UPI003D0BAC72
MNNNEIAITRPSTDQLYSKVTWKLIPFFCLCYFAAYLDRINVGLAKLQMAGDLGFSEAVYGLGAGLFFIGYVVFEIPSNLILQKVGARWWIARIMITWGLLSGATMLVTTPTQFYIVRFLLGVAEAGFVPGVLLYLTYWYPTYKRGKIIGLFMMGLPAAALIGSPLSGWIMEAFDGARGFAGWQWLYFLEALPSVILGFLVFIFLPDGIKSAKWLNDEEKEELQHNLEQDHLDVKQKHSVRDALTSGRVWLLCFVDMSFMMGTYAISFWLPTLIREAGATSMSEIGYLTAIPHAFALVFLLLNGMSSDKHRERRWHLAVPLFIGATGLVLSTFFTDNLMMTVLCFTLANVGIVATYSVFWCLPGTFLRGAAAAVGIALITSVANIGGFVATSVLGWLKELTDSSSVGLITFAMFLVVSCILVLRLPKEEVNK